MKINNYIINSIWAESTKLIYNLKLVKITVGDSTIDLCKYKTLFSTAPYASYGGVWIKNENDIQGLIEELRKIKKQFNPNYILLKADSDYFKEFPGVFQLDLSYSTFILDLRNGKDEIWKQKLNKKTRNQTRKGLKQDLDIQLGEMELFEDYFSIISKCWRDLGTPTHSRSFHKAIVQGYGENSKLIVLYHNGKPVSTAMLLICKNTIHHPFAATIKKYNHLSINNVLYWEIIEFACKNKLEFWEMGRSPKGSGGAKFKLSWGAEEKQLYYYYLVNDKGDIPKYNNKLTKFATGVWKYFPLSIANYLGPKFIRKVL